MLGLIMAVAWFLIFVGLAIKWEKDPSILTATKREPGKPLEVQIPYRPKLRNPVLLALGFGLFPFWYVFGNNCFLTVPPAYVAAVYDPLRGGIQKEAMPEGFHLVMPWWETQLFTQQTQEYTMSATHHEGAVLGDDSIRCQTNEGMNVAVDCTVLFHVDPQQASMVWGKVGEEFVKLIVRPFSHNVMRMVVSKYSVVDVFSNKRKQIETEITESLKPMYAEKGLVLEQVLLRNIQYGNPAFAEAINEKQVAQQLVPTEIQKLKRAQIEKQTISAEARGEAQAISKRGATLKQNPEVVQYEFVQKAAPRMKSMYLPSGAIPTLMGGGR